MSQGRLILNVNSNFERGNTNGFGETLTSAVGSFLDRQDPRSNPKRRVFPNLLKSRSDYILNGRFSRRYSIASGGDIVVVAETIPVEPGMKVSVDLVYRYNGAPAVFTMEINGSDAVGKIAFATLPTDAPRYVPGNQFSYSWDGTSGVVDLKDTNQNSVDYWARIGFAVEIPTGVIQMDPTLSLTGPASATVLDVGEFSVQALDSVIHAGG